MSSALDKRTRKVRLAGRVRYKLKQRLNLKSWT